MRPRRSRDARNASDWSVEETSGRGRKLSGQLRGGKALKARSGQTQVWRREGVPQADWAHHWSVVVPGCEEMGRGGISCPGPLPPSPQTTKNIPIVFWILPTFIKAIDENDLANRSIQRLKEYVADPLAQESQKKSIPSRTNQKKTR